MIAPSVIIDTLAGAGISIALSESGNVRLKPRSALTEALQALVTANKPALCAWLAGNPHYSPAPDQPRHTHRAVKVIRFHDAHAPDGVLDIPMGASFALFRSLDAAHSAGCLTDQSKWAAAANLQKGYWLAWLLGALRGVTPFSVRSLDEGF